MTDQDEAEKPNGPDETESEAGDSDDAEDLWAAAMAEQEAQETVAESSEPEPEDEKEDLWAAAMAEQQAQETGAENSGPEPKDEQEDLWAAAMAEQAQTPAADKESNERSSSSTAAHDEEPQARPGATSTTDKAVEAEAAGERLFRPLEQSGENGAPRDLAMILDIPVRLSVELGRTKVTIKQLLEMAQGSVVELDGLAGEPMDILINGYLIAQGEVVVVEDKYGIRITEIVTPSERVQKLNR